MSGNFNSFSPYKVTADRYSSTIFISAQDRLEEITVDLRFLNCDFESSESTPWEWPHLSLAGFYIARMFIKYETSYILHSEIIGVPLQPLEDGQILFRIGGSTFGQVEGKYLGLVEIEFKGSDRSGNKIITARNYIPFEVREEFYCDPFDPDFSTCAKG